MWLGNRFRVLSLLVGDVGLAFLGGLLAVYLRFGAEAERVLNEQRGWWKLALMVGTALAFYYFFELYNLNASAQRAPHALIYAIAQASAATVSALALIYYLAPQLKLGRGVFGVSLLLLATLTATWRLLTDWLLKRRLLAERVLILGTDSNAVAIARETLSRRAEGYEVVGFIGDDPALVGRSLINPCVLGLTADLEEIVRQRHVNRLVVAVEGGLPLDPLLGLKLSEQLAIEESATFYERLTGKLDLERLSLSSLIFAKTSPSARLYGRMRRLVDVVLAACGLVVTAPLMLLAMLAIKLDSSGPVLYVQERVGQHGRIFKIIKLRSMCMNAEQHGAVWAAQADARVTRVGRVLRKLRIDELPQFINVLRGEMSFIGPRPERPAFVAVLENEISFYSQRHLVKPGLTGWAQVRCGYCASIEEARERHQYDLYYIKNQAPLLDALILLETVRVVCRGKLGR